jgi:hypothetical protein
MPLVKRGLMLPPKKKPKNNLKMPLVKRESNLDLSLSLARAAAIDRPPSPTLSCRVTVEAGRRTLTVGATLRASGTGPSGRLGIALGPPAAGGPGPECHGHGAHSRSGGWRSLSTYAAGAAAAAGGADCGIQVKMWSVPARRSGSDACGLGPADSD